MTQKEQREANVSRWSALVQEAESSSLTIREWCKAKGIRETTFYYWKKQIKAGGPAVPTSPREAGRPAPCFVEVDICTEEGDSPVSGYTDGLKGNSPRFLIRIHNCQIAVSRDFQEEDLRKIFRVASHVQ